ncbi:MAG: Rrf2 family transcriptional regulator, partial [Roseinatronobacter sp.]|nr:Rrf2 family transcriptional regulator [Roseinatronobacter sp.]
MLHHGTRRFRGAKKRLSKFSDYGLRMLLLAASAPGRNITIRDAAETYGISQAHLKKVVLYLAREGYLASERGHGGGFTLAIPATDIKLGELIRKTETDFALL